MMFDNKKDRERERERRAGEMSTAYLEESVIARMMQQTKSIKTNPKQSVLRMTEENTKKYTQLTILSHVSASHCRPVGLPWKCVHLLFWGQEFRERTSN